MHQPGQIEALKKDILFEDNHLIALNKHPGDIVQGDKTGDPALIGMVKEYIKHKYRKPGDVFLGLVHRVDRPVSGVVLFARTSKALARMNALLKAREVSKTYWAVSYEAPDPPNGRLQDLLYKDEKKNKSFVTNKPGKGAKEALLDYTLIGKGDRYSFIEVKLHSGRHHQIRVQLSHIGCTIRGDLKYGAPRSNPDGSIHLHAREMRFIHPVRKEEVAITAPPPEDTLWQAFHALAGQDASQAEQSGPKSS